LREAHAGGADGYRGAIPWLELVALADADSEEKHEPVSDIDTAAADSLKVLDPKWPIREPDMTRSNRDVCFSAECVAKTQK
jgi:hypothetical protein